MLTQIMLQMLLIQVDADGEIRGLSRHKYPTICYGSGNRLQCTVLVQSATNSCEQLPVSMQKYCFFLFFHQLKAGFKMNIFVPRSNIHILVATKTCCFLVGE